MARNILINAAAAAVLAGVCVVGALALTHFSAFVSAAGADHASDPATVQARGVTLTSVAFDMPDQAASYPAGPHMDVMNAHCLTCHSPTMVTNQPRLSADQWTSEVKKMRETYKATIDDKDVPDIVAYLVQVSAKLPPAAAPAIAKNPAGKVTDAGAASG
ncbi:MAG: hypothetical protein INR64_03810 [Caulobacteraceae bacterium]|nr:hypothetical protein [Caulobacter sp.]